VSDEHSANADVAGTSYLEACASRDKGDANRTPDELPDTRIFRLVKWLIPLVISTSYRGARCLICITVRHGAQLMHANVTRGPG